MTRVCASFVLALVIAGVPSLARAEFKAAEHPCILWTKQDADAIKKRIDAEPWAKDKVKALPNNTFGRLFRYQILGDKKAGDEERKYLLSFINAPLDGIADNGGSSGLHTDNYLHALRYDVLYDSLTAEQRQQLEATFRKHIELDAKTWQSDPNRLGFLPNLALPRRCGTLMMSVALQDEKTIRELWAAPGSFRWFFNDYLSDGQFYNEEFAKMTSLIGEFLIYARGLDRLGLSDLGYDFKGRTGGSLERYVHTYISIGYPRTDIPAGTNAYTRIAMGDARGGQLLQHFVVDPYYADGKGGWSEWYAANMNGRDNRGTKVDKPQTPQWFEILHARYPKEGYGYFLAQMHKPGEKTYYPTLFWGLDPLSVDQVQPPPAPSYVADERGFAFLRFDESPKYWESPAPAVALQLAQFYVHYTNDCFSLLGYQALNRPVYSNRAISAGYNGGAWDMTIRGHCGVVVDTEMVQPIGQVPARRDFASAVKFVSARGVALKPLKGEGEVRSSDQPHEAVSKLYSNMDLSRSLFLTNDYLFDVYQLADAAQAPRDFYWLVHAPGSAVPGAGQSWQPSKELQDTLFGTQWQGALDRTERVNRLYHLTTEGNQGKPWVTIANAKCLPTTDAPLSVTTIQDFHGDDIAKSRFGAAWYERKVGVRVSMLPAPGTTTWTFDTPESYTPGAPRTEDDKGRRAIGAEWGGVSIAIHRKAPATVFAALHEPYENGTPHATNFRAVQQTEQGLAAAVVGKTAQGTTINDRLLLQFDARPEAAVKQTPELEKDAAVKPLTFADQEESFTFVGHGYIRITPTAVDVTGPVQAIRVKVAGTPKLTVNGQDQSASVKDGILAWNR